MKPKVDATKILHRVHYPYVKEEQLFLPRPEGTLRVERPGKPPVDLLDKLPDNFDIKEAAWAGAATAKMRLVQLAEEIISILASDPQATVKVSLEITADFPSGVSDQIKRAVTENAASLGFKNKTWE